MKTLGFIAVTVLASGMLVGGAISIEGEAQAGESIYLLPEKPWSSVELSSREKNLPRYLSLPSLETPRVTLEDPLPPRDAGKKLKRVRETNDSGAGFIAVDPMAISGRTSKPSLPFGLVRETVERSYNLPKISPVEALQSSTEKIQ
jgi:hypothetical protein